MALRRIPAALGLVLALLLTGCATVPVSSPVQTTAPQKQGGDPAAVFLPNPPQDGMSAQDVVRGFVTAASAGRDYRVAKEYLTPSFRSRWRPNASVLVHASPWDVQPLDGDRIRLVVPTVGKVDGQGIFTSTSGTADPTYELTRVGAQWRISDGPDGVVLTERVFPQVFSPTRLQFFDPQFRQLVPDVRWFAKRADLGSAVVSALIAGQAPVLREVTEPVFPSGTRLAAPVRTTGGITTVSVTVPGGSLDQRATDRIQQALAAPLSPNTASLRLVVNGRQAAPAPAPDLDQPSITDSVVVADGRFGALTARGTVTEDRELGPRIVAQKPRAATVSARQRVAAVLTGGGQVAVVSRSGVRLADDRRDLAAPALDQRGWVYSVPEDGPGGLQVASSSTGRRYAVSTELDLTGASSIEVSTDGTRLLVVQPISSGTSVYVEGILRNADGRPVGLTTDRVPIEVDAAATAVDATWVDPTTVAVLTNNASVESVVQQQLGGIPGPLGLLLNAKSVVGATALQDLRALSGSGGLLKWSPSANSWGVDSPASVKIDVLAVQR